MGSHFSLRGEARSETKLTLVKLAIYGQVVSLVEMMPLETSQSREMGRQQLALEGSPDLRIGMTLETFHWKAWCSQQKFGSYCLRFWKVCQSWQKYVSQCWNLWKAQQNLQMFGTHGMKLSKAQEVWQRSGGLHSTLWMLCKAGGGLGAIIRDTRRDAKAVRSA